MIGMGAFALNLIRPSTTRGLPKPDVVIGSTVHLLAAWAGARLARRHSVPFVFEIRDVWPDVLIDLGKVKPGGIFARSVNRLSVTLSRRAALVISPLPGVRGYLDAHDLSGVPFAWIPNGVDTTVEETIVPEEHGSFTFMYLGSHNHSNAIDDILEAFDLASAKRPDLDMRLRLVGGGPQKPALESMAAKLSSAQRINFEPEIPRSAVLARAREADCLVAALHDNRVYRYGISLNKLFDYMMAGRPVIFASNASNNPVQEAGAGPLVAADEPEALASAMIAMATESPEERTRLGVNGMKHVREHYSYEVLSGLLASALNESIDPGSAGHLQAPKEGENVR
ncbi:hypothetical protein ASF62_12195 [Leifsonia sp. Leaf325]|nr:hypothetical protein ASF62_12195 [Leifsonia sp. Leaf325]